MSLPAVCMYQVDWDGLGTYANASKWSEQALCENVNAGCTYVRRLQCITGF